MHIPDGYLAPAFSLGMGIVTVPAWVVATQRVKKVLSHRTIPLMAIFAAFCFALMMFNVPVPGGTTAHGVGGTLVAIILGPAAAIVVVSTALIIQALFFGDGGVLAIFANCLNMAIILPIVGYWSYRLIAGRSPLLSARRAWAAGIGAYVGITVAALSGGIMLGLQPLLFNQNGQPLYSPYPLSVSVPAMLLAHAFGASIVEGLITGLGLAYVQQHHPEYLTSLRNIVSGPDVLETGQAAARPLWQLIGAGVIALAVLLFGAALVTGGGDLSHAFGADWTTVSVADVGTMVLISAILLVVLTPLAWYLLPKALRGIGTAYVAIAVLTSLGLIAPGIAFGEGVPTDLQQQFGYVPEGLQQLNGLFTAPLSGYNLPFPFFNDASAPLWHQALGYDVAAIVGMLVLGLVVWGLGSLLLRLRGPGVPDPAGTGGAASA